MGLVIAILEKYKREVSEVSTMAVVACEKYVFWGFLERGGRGLSRGGGGVIPETC